MQFVILVLLSVIAAGVVFLLVYALRTAPAREELGRFRVLNDEKDRRIEELSSKVKSFGELQEQKTRLEADLANERRSAREKLLLLETSETRLKTEFENLANRIFEEKGKTFSSQSNEKLDGLLRPLRDQIEAFRRRVDEVHRDDTEGMAKLLTQVRHLQELNNRVCDEANNLAEAIKGDSKAQGNWGELIVERIFEASGLERGREYTAQTPLRTEDGRLQRPDFIVYLPGGKAVIVDSKVSLTAYERFCSEQGEKERLAALTGHIGSVRKHIEDMRRKSYQHLLGNRSLDFIIMCIPIEPAYQLAFQHDKNLLYDLAQGNVVITGPATLMLTLKLIAQIWRRENESRNVERIADRSGRLYDQVALVIEAMVDSQKKLDGVRDSFGLAMNRLTAGKGNLVGRIEELRKLGAKTSKQLPAAIAERASEQVGFFDAAEEAPVGETGPAPAAGDIPPA